jgi:hypothetical protein
MSGKWREVGRRGEVGRREKFWGKKGAEKSMGRGRGCVFGSSPKQVEQPHPELVHWWLLVHSNPGLESPNKWNHLVGLLGIMPIGFHSLFRLAWKASSGETLWVSCLPYTLIGILFNELYFNFCHVFIHQHLSNYQRCSILFFSLPILFGSYILREPSILVPTFLFIWNNIWFLFKDFLKIEPPVLFWT